jgi:CHAT domain-containing protein
VRWSSPKWLLSTAVAVPLLALATVAVADSPVDAGRTDTPDDVDDSAAANSATPDRAPHTPDPCRAGVASLAEAQRLGAQVASLAKVGSWLAGPCARAAIDTLTKATDGTPRERANLLESVLDYVDRLSQEQKEAYKKACDELLHERTTQTPSDPVALALAHSRHGTALLGVNAIDDAAAEQEEAVSHLSKLLASSDIRLLRAELDQMPLLPFHHEYARFATISSKIIDAARDPAFCSQPPNHVMWIALGLSGTAEIAASRHDLLLAKAMVDAAARALSCRDSPFTQAALGSVLDTTARYATELGDHVAARDALQRRVSITDHDSLFTADTSAALHLRLLIESFLAGDAKALDTLHAWCRDLDPNTVRPTVSVNTGDALPTSLFAPILDTALLDGFLVVGRILLSSNRAANAVDVFLKGMTLAKDAANEYTRSDMRDGLAAALLATGKPADAEQLLLTSVSSADESTPPILSVWQRLRLAQFYVGLGRWDDAFKWAKEGNVRFQDSDRQHVESPLALDIMSFVQFQTGHPAEAFPLLQRSLQLADTHFVEFFANGSDAGLIQGALDQQDSTNRMLLVQQALPDSLQVAQAAFETLLRRHDATVDLLSSHYQRTYARAEPSAGALLDDLANARRELSAAVGGPANAPTAADAISNLRERIENLENSLSARGFDVPALKTVTAADVASHLADDAALVHFAAVWPQPPEMPYYVAFVARHGAPVRAFRLATISAVHGYAASWRQELRRAGSQAAERYSRALYGAVWSPLESAVGASRELFVVPEGDLSVVPFAALLDGSGHYLLEAHTLSLLSSGREVVADAGRRHIRPQAPPELIGSPDFGAAARTITGEVTRGAFDLLGPFEPLPGTTAELTQISSILGVAPVTGPAATKAKLEGLHGPSILHVATHGFFLKDLDLSNARQRYYLSRDNTIRTRLNVENPLLRSGLALAGADRVHDHKFDGIITSLELSGLDLRGTQLVVLSACNTGLGDIVNGEGVFGMQRALQIAGAESVVMSLWDVDDASTARFVSSMYAHLARGEGRAQALRSAQLELMRDNSTNSPYYWAAFVEAGDWRPLANGVLPGGAAPPAQGCGHGCEIATLDERPGRAWWLAVAVGFACVRRCRRKLRTMEGSLR